MTSRSLISPELLWNVTEAAQLFWQRAEWPSLKYSLLYHTRDKRRIIWSRLYVKPGFILYSRRRVTFWNVLWMLIMDTEMFGAQGKIKVKKKKIPLWKSSTLKHTFKKEHLLWKLYTIYFKGILMWELNVFGHLITC